MATEYVVLRLNNNGRPSDVEWKQWAEIGRASTDTPKAAIKAATKDLDTQQRQGTFIATPARSFKPVTRGVESREHDVWA